MSRHDDRSGQVIPAHLDLLSIYSPALGLIENNEKDQILFYYSAAQDIESKSHRQDDEPARDREQEDNEQLRQVGLAQGIVTFAKLVYDHSHPSSNIDHDFQNLLQRRKRRICRDREASHCFDRDRKGVVDTSCMTLNNPNYLLCSCTARSPFDSRPYLPRNRQVRVPSRPQTKPLSSTPPATLAHQTYFSSRYITLTGFSCSTMDAVLAMFSCA